MSQSVQQVVGVQGQMVQGQVVQGQVVQGQVVQGQMVSGGQVTTGQMVMTSAANLTALPQQQQIVTQLVSGQTVQGTIAANTVGTTTIAPGHVTGQSVGDMQQMVAASSTPGVQHVVQQVTAAQQVTQPQMQTTNTNPNNSATVVKQPVTQAVPPPTLSMNLSESSPPVITKQRMSELVREVDPNEQLDEDVEELLMSIADDFIESTVTAACRLAKHRGSRTLEVKDVQMYLEKNWHMWIPGFGTEELRPYKRAPTTEAHKQRLALLRKAVKKY